MIIYLVRHAEAIESNGDLPDSMRCLSRNGRKQIAKQADNLRKHKVKPSRLLTSPLVRAVQTSELLSVEMKIPTIIAHPCLLPDADPELVVEMIADAGMVKSLMLVGHDPQLSAVAAQLLGYEFVAKLQKGSCLALTWKPEQHANIVWLATKTGRFSSKRK